MSGLNEIIQWVEDNYDFEEGEDPVKAFNTINDDEDWNRENRSELPDILGNDMPAFMRFLEEQTSTTREDLQINKLDQQIAQLEEEIRGFFNILGTPIR